MCNAAIRRRVTASKQMHDCFNRTRAKLGECLSKMLRVSCVWATFPKTAIAAYGSNANSQIAKKRSVSRIATDHSRHE